LIVFQLLVENMLELRLSECRFLYEEIDFLGYVISAKGIHSTKSGIAAVKEFSTPKCVRDVQSSSDYVPILENLLKISH
jgi:hypothetical protein